MRPLRIGVIGLGAMGQNHARILSELDTVSLVAVCDALPQTVKSAAKKFRATGYASYQEMLAREKLDAVTIAVPSRLHVDVGVAALQSQVHVLVEKPIAVELVAAERLIQAASVTGMVLAVGHIERFNPAVRELKRRLALDELGRIFQIHARRVGPFPPRIRDVGVVVDLATHDLDIMRYLVNADVIRVYAETQNRIHTAHEDMLSALLKFSNGAVGLLDVNWLTPTKIRELTVLGDRGMFHVDYLNQTLTLHENQFDARTEPAGNLPRVIEGRIIRYQVEHAEALRVELAAFVRSILDGTPPEVGPQDGVEALRLALRLVEAGSQALPAGDAKRPGATSIAAVDSR